ncbi:efflux RND transporter periplasmic adaptor subunit [Mesonia sp.]|uniref:efflux RND transporter periplasmic adaptor subunit n=1 Tax=Mesonia sp. TaxID=1960830 RepID=UPI00176A55BC|nr:efflux RND transporter periplasmic adaptor subunit [Mesonia sp.]HIB36874.1 efflux RND transporter periplasmic adaptor subunit [Mesonia sp.]HIO26997.1 efflux RND transporter periplasmic adaptor subunit [Flavobacteriaceae bacterium]
MKKYLIYLLLLIGGIFLGYLFFNSSSEEKHQHTQTEENQIWTCSMHPQVERQEPGDCPICGMELIPKETAGSNLAENEFTMTTNAMALANIETTIVGESQNDNGSLQLSGEITANEDETATQPAHFNGRIEKLYVKSLGEKVQMGQAIASIYSPDLVAAQQELISAYQKRKSQPRLYQAVRNKFKNWRITESQLQQIEESQTPLTNITIYAHVSGIITSIEVNEGAHIMDGKPIFKIANLSTVWAAFNAYENEIKSLKEGQKININTEAYPDENFEAEINFIDPVLNSSTRTVTVRAELTNKNNLLKPGMFVTAKVKSDNENSKSISIPKSAVMWTGERSLVYLKTNDNPPTFEMREVKLGAENGNKYSILSGLQKGDEIVTNGTFTVDAAAQLQGKKSMMTSENNLLQLSKEIQEQFREVIKNYLQLKNDLVNDRAEASKNSAQKALTQLQAINTSEEETSAKINSLKEGFSNINKADQIKVQREYFISLSEEMISISKQIETSKKLFVQKCPMANNNQGAKWLSLEEEIKNPYYGASMLGCGSVIEVIN